ncbi:MAG: FAD-binding domain-containing protein [Pseudomonadota bacterium]
MTPIDYFPAERSEALQRISAIRPGEYARSRNHLDGAVTRLSPYITHGLVSLPEVLSGVAANHTLDIQHKLVYELGWREYFRHVWQHCGDGILESIHPGALPDHAYAESLPNDIRQARTGVPVIDQSVRTLYATGYLHNHARMWLASYVVHLRKVHWRAGADWLFAHLLDGDLASNHLSWQWVAGTGSHKPYLFNADNVARYAPQAWHSPGTALDTSYEQLDTIARSRHAIALDAEGEGVEEPPLLGRPPEGEAPNGLQVQGRDVWLLHPWALNDLPADLPADVLAVGWWPSEFHVARPWSAARWAFVGQRMGALAACVWCSDRQTLERALAGARSVATVADPHISALLPPCVDQRPAMALFPAVTQECASFSAWWRQATRRAKVLSDLPGLGSKPSL